MVQKLTTYERVELIFLAGKLNCSNRSIAKVFNEAHPNRTPIAQGTVGKIIKRFRETGSVHDRARSGRPRSSTDEDSAARVVDCVLNSPKKSIRKLSQETSVCRRSIQRILKKNNFHPYKVHLVQELHGDDTDRRMEFCQWFLAQENLIQSVMFSDEAIFHLSGNVNRHNFRYWSNQNPRWIEATHVQIDPRVMVWAAIWRNHIIGPYFFDGNVTGESYLQMLHTFLLPRLRNDYADELDQFWFQHDGAPAHFALSVRRVLDELFPNRWIGRRGPVEWPPRSPDLSPLDFFLWGHLKSVVYTNRPRTIEDLKGKIVSECRNITDNVLKRVQASCIQRIKKCLETSGEQFEHLLK
jgi:transposase